MNCGILIPMYIYPSDIATNVDYNNLIELKKKYRNVPLIVILNPGWGTGGLPGGPGLSVDGNYTVAIKRLKGAGAIVIGYVSTQYAARSEANVYADIDLWKSYYPELDGIFFDEMSNDWIANVDDPYDDPAWPKVELYMRYRDYCRDLLYSPIIGNPGANTPEVWFKYKVMDIITVYENQDYPSPTNPILTLEQLKGEAWNGTHRDYPITMRNALIYNVETFDEAQTLECSKYVGSIYVTNDMMTGEYLNPWDSLPPYLEDLFKALSKKEYA